MSSAVKRGSYRERLILPLSMERDARRTRCTCTASYLPLANTTPHPASVRGTEETRRD